MLHPHAMAEKLLYVLFIQIKQNSSWSLIFSFKISEDGKFLGPMSGPIFLCRRKLIGRWSLELLEMAFYIILRENKIKGKEIIEVMSDPKFAIEPPWVLPLSLFLVCYCLSQ